MYYPSASLSQINEPRVLQHITHLFCLAVSGRQVNAQFSLHHWTSFTWDVWDVCKANFFFCPWFGLDYLLCLVLRAQTASVRHEEDRDHRWDIECFSSLLRRVVTSDTFINNIKSHVGLLRAPSLSSDVKSCVWSSETVIFTRRRCFQAHYIYRDRYSWKCRGKGRIDSTLLFIPEAHTVFLFKCYFVYCGVLMFNTENLSDSSAILSRVMDGSRVLDVHSVNDRYVLI